MTKNPYIAGLSLVKLHDGTSGQAALAKCILSLYNREHAFSIGEIIWPLSGEYLAVVIAMVNEYAQHGETEQLRQAGEYVYKNFPRLVELSKAMSDARFDVREKWRIQHEEKLQRLYPDN